MFFLQNESINSFILASRMNLWCPSFKKIRLLCESMIIPIEKQTLIPNLVERENFFRNQSINVIYPNEENVLMVPNHEKEEDYYVNPSLSKMKDVL